ncbi:MAG: ribosome silencing factor [Deltaproteobacteria bacterium]|nr:ribosome silencing factor [Deltaproteobacteria bacterium]
MKLCAGFASDMKAQNMVVLDVKEQSAFTSYFIICSGASTRQVQAVAENVELMMKKAGFRARGSEGMKNGRWILLDYDDVIMHVFHEEERAFYDLENLWQHCPRIAFDDVPVSEKNKR